MTHVTVKQKDKRSGVVTRSKMKGQKKWYNNMKRRNGGVTLSETTTKKWRSDTNRGEGTKEEVAGLEAIL